MTELRWAGRNVMLEGRTPYNVFILKPVGISLMFVVIVDFRVRSMNSE
jgi:hypothetical protein